MKNFYAVEYSSGCNTTTGEPNARTGRMSIAVSPVAFASKTERGAWVDSGNQTSSMRGNCREAVTLRQLRDLSLGLSVAEFAEHVQYLHYA